MTRWEWWYINNGALDHGNEYWDSFSSIRDAVQANYESLVCSHDCSDDKHPDDFVRVSVHDPHNENELYHMPAEDTHAIALMLSSSNGGREMTYLVREGYWEVYNEYGRPLWRDSIDNTRTFSDRDAALRYIIRPEHLDDARETLRNQDG